MLKGKKVAVTIPAYNEEKLIPLVIETMPDFVDRIVIVNDASTDKTEEVVKKVIEEDKTSVTPIKKEKVKRTFFNRSEVVVEKLQEEEMKYYTPQHIVNKNPSEDRIILITHEENGSVGAAISSGYKWCKDNEIDCTAVMGADAQMDPAELESICMPVIDGEVDYTKGNRLSHQSALFVVPKVRYFGNSVLSLLTKIASGYWHVSDTQSGYTAISLKALNGLKIYKIYKTYGVPNDILVKLNIIFAKIKEIDIKPVYDVGEQSKMKVFKVIPKISWLLFKAFWKRLYVKYLFKDFHPLFLLYHLSFFLILLSVPFAIQAIKAISPDVHLSMQSLIILIFLLIIGFQSLFFAMWMDMMDNERLQK